MQGYGIQLVGPAYFQAALQLMRTVLVKPVFLVVTDDMPWARKHITGEDVFYSESATSQAARDAVGTDMAILAACNHTIITYGTFGLWGALLAGGATVMSSKAKVKCNAVQNRAMCRCCVSC
jgi:galactoside 2-L-fucosyltransferase 1/2